MLCRGESKMDYDRIGSPVLGPSWSVHISATVLQLVAEQEEDPRRVRCAKRHTQTGVHEWTLVPPKMYNTCVNTAFFENIVKTST
jgi:hypothetical protein